MSKEKLTLKELAHFKVMLVFTGIMAFITIFLPRNPLTMSLVGVFGGIALYENIWLMISSYRIRKREGLD